MSRLPVTDREVSTLCMSEWLNEQSLWRIYYTPCPLTTIKKPEPAW